MTSSCNPCESSVAGQSIEILNSKCFCISLEDGALKKALKSDLEAPEIFTLIEERNPYLFSANPVFISDSHIKHMAKVIHAIESVVALPAYRELIFASAPDISRHDLGGPLGVFFGYDFHLHDDDTGLIEINTNAGGAMLNSVLTRAHHSCCAVMDKIVSNTAAAVAFEQSIIDMFQTEWRLGKRNRPLQTIAIVDESPEQQYLYSEFLLFQKLFNQHGYRSVIVDPSSLRLQDGALWYQNIEIDLVYNRLTDFLLESPSSSVLRTAYLDNAVVLTPHPQVHALYADKRNLVLFSNRNSLDSLGVPEETQDILLANIPHTEIVDTGNTERLWRERRNLFFKPASGYGGRAAYRGDKITKRVWQEILAGNYIAQQIFSPGQRVIGTRDNPQLLKFDIRNYTYNGQIQWTAARMYQGQTTNFRTPGGGFAPVYSIPDEDLTCGFESIERLVATESVAAQK